MPALAGAEPGDLRRRRSRPRPPSGRRRWPPRARPGARPAPCATAAPSSRPPWPGRAGRGERLSSATTRGVGLLEHLGQVVLVDLQHRERRGAGLGQRRGVPGRHVGAERVGGDLAEHAERGGGEPGGGGLAVGAGDQGDRAGRRPGARAGRGRSSGRSSRRSPSRRRARRRGTGRPRYATPSSRPSPAGASSRPSRERGYRTTSSRLFVCRSSLIVTTEWRGLLTDRRRLFVPAGTDRANGSVPTSVRGGSTTERKRDSGLQTLSPRHATLRVRGHAPSGTRLTLPIPPRTSHRATASQGRDGGPTNRSLAGRRQRPAERPRGEAAAPGGRATFAPEPDS